MAAPFVRAEELYVAAIEMVQPTGRALIASPTNYSLLLPSSNSAQATSHALATSK